MGFGSRAGRAVEHGQSPRSPRPAAIGQSGSAPDHTRDDGGVSCSSVEFRRIGAFAARPLYGALGILACYAGLFYVALEAVR